MEIFQTYETTIFSRDLDLGATVLVIPARSLRGGITPNLHFAAESLFAAQLDPYGSERSYIDPQQFASMLSQPMAARDAAETLAFASYVLTARIIPFESSPLGAESLASIAASSVKAGTVTLGATVGYIAAGSTPFLLITVPLGIILCGASVSFARWMEDNRNIIWKRLSGLR
jgi:hypothetical protein